MSETDSRETALLIGNHALEKKAENVVILDIHGTTAFCDYFVIASSNSFKKARAVADHILGSLEEKSLRPHHKEGIKDAQWILLDYGSVIAHVFYEETRKFYGLERLWGDAKRIELTSK